MARRSPRFWPIFLGLFLLPPGTALARDLVGDEYAAVLDFILAARPQRAEALLDSLAAECAGEPLYLIARGRLLLESVPIDDLDKEATRAAAQPALRVFQQVIDVCSQRLADGGNEMELRRYRGWAWMERSQLHALGRSFWSAGREAGRGKDDLEFYLAAHPAEPVASGLLGAFLYFTDAVPDILQLLSKLLFLPTGDRDRGLAMINDALAAPSPKQEDFRMLAATVNVYFEGRWEEGLDQVEALHAAYPGYVRLALAPAVMRLWAPGREAVYAAMVDATERAAAARDTEGDEASLWTLRTFRAWTDRFLHGPAAAEPRFAAIAAGDPASPDWVADFARRQLGEMAFERSDPEERLEDDWIAAIAAASRDSLSALAARFEARAPRSLRAAFYAAECRLRLGDYAAATTLYREVVARDGAAALSGYRMVAATRVAEIAARDGRYRSATRWLDRALDHFGGEYRADWIIEGRKRFYEELMERGDSMNGLPVLFRGLD